MTTWMVAGSVCDPLDENATLLILMLGGSPFVASVRESNGGIEVLPGRGLAQLMDRVFDDRESVSPEDAALVDAAEEAFSHLASAKLRTPARLLSPHLATVNLADDKEPTTARFDPRGMLCVDSFDTGDSFAHMHCLRAGPLEAVATALLAVVAEGRTRRDLGNLLAERGVHIKTYTTYYD